MPIHWLMAHDTAPTSCVIDIDPRSHHLTPQIFLSSEAFSPRDFLAHFTDDVLVWDSFLFSDHFSGIFILLAVSGMDFRQCQPPCSYLIASDEPSTESASDVWAWPMRDTLSLDFLTASTVRILHLKHWALDSRFLIENLPFSPAAPPGVRLRSSRLWRVSSFNFLSLHRLGVTPQILRSSFLTAVLHPA